MPQPERELARLLDEVAVAVHASELGGPYQPGEEEAPDRDYEEARALAASRFPDFGYYRAASLELVGEPGIGDAIDDLADLWLEFTEVAWLWDHAGESAARWRFHLMYACHWGDHLRGLQGYLHERKSTE